MNRDNELKRIINKDSLLVKILTQASAPSSSYGTNKDFGTILIPKLPK